MSKLMDELSELVYVADMDSYDLLYVNAAGREMFHIDQLDGKKCYKTLQGLDSPCPFCTNQRLRVKQVYTWEYTNPLLHRHYLLEDRIIEWEGKPARFEIAFDITKKENEKISLKNALDAEKMVLDCVKILDQSEEPDRSIPAVLKRLGTFLSAERAYTFEVHGHTMSNTAEWCAKGIEPQIENLQDLDLSLLDRWRVYFDQHECMILENLEEIRESNPAEYAILAGQGITSLVAAPLERDGRLIGYLGVDNPPQEKVCNITSLLHTLRYFLMSSLRRSEDEKLLIRLSYYDTLTGFYNRNRYNQDMERLASRSGPFGILYLDINGLKDINDHYGHDYGDQILIECAQQIAEVFPDADIYRIGGDEFIVLCAPISEDKFQDTVLELKKGFALHPSCHAAIGYQWSDNVSNVQQLISIADAMMYEDKKKFYRQNPSSKRYRHYNDVILSLVEPGILQKKIEQNHFIVYFQPKMSYQDRSLIGVEALVRYRTSDGTILSPGQFLPLLENARLISLIDFYVFDYVCSKIAQWLSEGKKIVPVSANFSRYSLLEPDFINQLAAICVEYGISHSWVEIEITETVEGIEEIDTSKLITEIRDAGFAVSIDDFGVHYANLSLFTSIDFDVLKIDKSLIDNIVSNPKAQSVVGALADVCQKMEIRTIAEGVETEDQFQILKQMGFGGAQGYLFSCPIPVQEFEGKFLQQIDGA